jgi:hypothetical protein
MRSLRISDLPQTLRIGLLTIALAVFPQLSAAAPGTWSVIAGSVTAAPGDLVDIPILLDSGGVAISAIAFTIEWDAQKLLLAGDPAAGSKVDLPAPARFTSSSWVSTAGASIGITVYDRERPLESLPDGPVAILRFRVRPDAQGFAAVTVRSESLSASTARATLVTGARIVSGGVSISAARPSLHLTPSDLHFGSVGLGASERRTAVVVNAGSGPLTLQEVRVEGSPAFSLAGPSVPRVIQAGSSIPLELAFSPTERGELSARLVAVSSEAGTATIELRGAGSDGELYYDLRLLVPAVASLQSGEGSRWLSTLSLYNAGSTPAGARFHLLRAGVAAFRKEASVIIEGGQSLSWEDVVGDLFGEKELSGALWIDTTTDALIVRSSTYNEISDGGRIAQSVPVIAQTQLFHTGEEARLIGLEKSPVRRTNVTIMNLGKTPASLAVELLNADGALLDSMMLSLDAGQIAPVIPLIDRLPNDATDLVILVRATTPGAEFFAYASTVDGRTGAPLFQSPR